MTNHIRTFLFLFCIVFISCGTINKSELNQENTFILFDKSNFETKRINKSDAKVYSTEYSFSIHDYEKSSYPTGIITFFSKKYKNYNDKIKDNPLPNFKVNKSFIRNNKNIIFTLEDMRKMGYSKAIEMFTKAKHIFLIDKENIKNNSIVIKEVLLMYKEGEHLDPNYENIKN